jgi:hypothetical protein
MKRGVMKRKYLTRSPNGTCSVWSSEDKAHEVSACRYGSWVEPAWLVPTAANVPASRVVCSWFTGWIITDK